MKFRAAFFTAVLLIPAACSRSSSGTPGIRLTVLAASSLSDVLPQISTGFAKDHPGVTFGISFAGTDQLAVQIQQGAPVDVFAGASTSYGDQLASAGLIDPYKVFCTNRLVLITPASNPAGIGSLAELATGNVKLVIGSETVPVGVYSRKVLVNLDVAYGSGYSAKVLSRVVSNEDSVSAIVAKVESGEADAGFVYATDALAAGAKLKAIDLPADAQAVARYPAAAIKASANATLAQQFVDYLIGSTAQAMFKAAGFGPPPTP